MCFLLMMCHMTVRRPNFKDASQSHIINTVVALVSFRAWKFVVIVMIKKEKTFFHLVTTFTTPWSREKKVFFISRYAHYTIIKREKKFFFLVTTFTTPWSRQKKVFLHLVTTFTAPWPRQKKVFLHLVTTFTAPWSREEKVFFRLVTTFMVTTFMIKRKKFSFL